MTTASASPSHFYASRQGEATARIVGARLAALWPSLPGSTILGIGHAAPYLACWQDARCIAFAPGTGAPTRWPEHSPSLTCAGEEDHLPFPDLLFDRIVLVHGLELAGRAGPMLREAWRVLKDDGRLLVVASNRSGMWAHVESTPFGQGQPYSAAQVGRLLAKSLFRVERREVALFMPPVDARMVLRSAHLFEAAGRRLAPSLAGVTITEAVKDVWAAIPLLVGEQRRAMARRVVLARAA